MKALIDSGKATSDTFSSRVSTARLHPGVVPLVCRRFAVLIGSNLLDEVDLSELLQTIVLVKRSVGSFEFAYILVLQ